MINSTGWEGGGLAAGTLGTFEKGTSRTHVKMSFLTIE